VHLVLVFLSVNIRVPEVVQNLWHNCAKRRYKGGEDHFVPVSGINRLAGICEDKEMLPDLVELREWIRDVYVADVRIDVITAHVELEFWLHSIGSWFFSDGACSCVVMCLAIVFSTLQQLCLLVDVVVIFPFFDQGTTKGFFKLFILQWLYFVSSLGRFTSFLINWRNLRHTCS